MNTVKAAALTILFLLIPHQEPRADSVQEVAPRGDAPTPAPSTAMAESDGFLWSPGVIGDVDGARTEPARHLSTDGYSWSVGTDRPVLASKR